MIYNFNRTKYIDKNDIVEQLEHMASELREIKQELFAADIPRLAEETVDLYHSCESMMRILEEKYGIDINGVVKEVKIKNEKRGYYGDLRGITVHNSVESD